MDNQKIEHIYRNKISRDERRKMTTELLMTTFYLAMGLGIILIGVGAVAVGVLFIMGILK